MPSMIDETMPVAGNPTTESVRANFATAKAEISALQAATAVVEPLWVGAGSTTIPDGTTKVFVDAVGPVTLILPPDDVSIMDRGPSAGTYPIICQPPAGGTINGNPDYRILDDWGTARFFYDGANFGVG